jgi:hypothetical protein
MACYEAFQPRGMTFYAALAVLLEHRARRVARFAMRGRRH